MQYLADEFRWVFFGGDAFSMSFFEAALPFCVGSRHVEFNVRHWLKDCFERDDTFS